MSDQVKHAIDKGKRVGWIPRNKKVNMVFAEEVSVKGLAAGKNSPAEGIRACQDNDLRRWDRIIADLQRIGHAPRYGPGDHDAVGMTRRSHEFNAKPSHVEVDIPGGIQFHFR